MTLSLSFLWHIAVRTIESDIIMDDFELVVDEHTGESVLRLRPDVAIRKGLVDLANANFEAVFDPITAQIDHGYYHSIAS